MVIFGAVLNSDAMGPIYEGQLSGDTVHVTRQTDLRHDVASGSLERKSHAVDQKWYLTPQVLQSSGPPARPVKCPPGLVVP